MRITPQPDRAGVVLVLLCSIFAAASILGLYLDRTPPNWDDAWYLTNSLTVYDALAHGGIPGYLAKLNTVFGFKAPLIAALPTPFYLLFGRRWHAAYLVNIAGMFVLFWALYRIASRWWSRRAALFAVAIAGTMPLLYGLSRWYMVEYPMTALVAVSVLLMIESNRFERRRMALSFGVACGLGMLLKVSFAAFLLPAFVWFWAGSRRRARALALAAVPCLLVAMPWYAVHLAPTLKNALDAGFGHAAQVQGTGPIFALATITTYLSHVMENGISWYYAALTTLLILWIACRRAGRFWLLTRPKESAAVLLFWLLPFAIFLFGGNKDIRFIAPLLPALALGIACLLDGALPRSFPGAILAFLFLAYPMAQLFSVSFGVPWRAAGLTYAQRFNRTPWPHGEILKAIAADTRLGPAERVMLLVGVDRSGLNANNVELTVAALQLPIDVETTAHEENFETLKQRLAQAAYFLYKDGGEPESPAFNPYAAQLVTLAARDARYTELFARRLPDGGIARVLKNTAAQSRPAPDEFTRGGTQIPEEFTVDFGGVLALTGFSTVNGQDILTVRFRWRCLKPPDRDYWCFTHLIDAQGRIVAQRDHRLLGGDPPLLSWRPGDSGAEEIRLALPAGLDAGACRLRFGLYHPPSGQRLQVGSPASAFTLADHVTAVLAPIRAAAVIQRRAQ